MTLHPTSITASRKQRTLTILWDDGRLSAYPFGLLRLGCPCAECRGGHDKMGSEPDPQVFTMRLDDEQKTGLKDIVAVGSYAVTFIWLDGHDAGIYQWQYLRALCPCLLCRK
ncbi:MAG: DUF971 domain-containing protein [Chloroflexi bacterium]|nr:DUF971 domain-containing protein [Chloroflexota bacterium]